MMHYVVPEEDSTKPALGMVIHGGAGVITREKMTPELEKAYHATLKEALSAGYEILRNGGTSMDAVVATIKVMEDSPLFNAGKGAVFTSEGTNELDASIMDGQTLNAGAIAGVKHIKNPIILAQLVLEESPHVMMVGSGAESFAREFDVEWVEQDYFRTEERWQQLQHRKDEEKKKIKDAAETDNKKNENKYGTVGAVALDKHGDLVAGTSTGGMTYKRFGRVSDSPLIGAGTYANNETCAVSATGHGEYFIRLNVTHDISAKMAYEGKTLKEAANDVIMKKLGDLGGTGGVIAIDKDGNFAMPFNTEGMYRGYVSADGNIVTKIYKE